MNRLLVAGAVVLAGVLLVGCAPEAGDVVDREYSAPYSWVDQQCATVTQPNGGASQQVCTPITRYEDESFNLRLDDGEDAGWRAVPAGEYDRCHEGDHYPTCAREGARR